MDSRVAARIAPGGLLARIPLVGGRFARDTLTLTVGLVSAQAITFFTSPIVTRIYGPAEFGIFSTFFTQVSTVAAVACLAYETAIVLPERDEDAATLLALCVAITVALSGASLVAVALFGDDISRALRAPALAPWLWWAPLTLLFMGVYQALNYWCTRTRQFGYVSGSRIGQSATTVGVQIAGSGPAGLIVGTIAGQALAAAVLIASAARRVLAAWRADPPTMTAVRTQAWRYRRFPLYASWGTFMLSGSFQVVPLLLSSFFNPAVAGLYFLVYRLASIPMSFLGSAIGQVLLQRSAERLARGEGLADLVEKAVGKLILVGALPFAGLAIAAPPLFGFVFGEEWAGAGVYLSIMVPLFFLQFLTGPVSMVLIALQRQRAASIVQTGLLVGALASLAGGARVFQEPGPTLGLYCAVQCAVYLAYLGTVVYFSHASPRRILREALSFR